MQDGDEETRKAATEKYIDYINSIMSTSLCDFEVKIRHGCMSSDEEASSVLEEEPLQTLRDCRSKSLCADLMGRVMRCKKCKEAVSADDFLVMALNYFWRKQVGLSLPFAFQPICQLTRTSVHSGAVRPRRW